MNATKVAPFVISGLFACVLVIGCGTFPTVEPVEVVETPSDMTYLTVRTEVEIDGAMHQQQQMEVEYYPQGEQPNYGPSHSDPQAQSDDAEVYERLWKQLIEEQLSEAGVRVVGDRGPEPAITLYVHVEPTAPSGAHVSMEMANSLRWQVTMSHQDQAVDGAVWNAPFYVSSDGFESRREAERVHHQSLAARVVNSLFESRPVHEVARGLSPQPAQDAVASTDTTAAEPIPIEVEGHLVAAPQPNAYALVVGIEDYRDLTPTPGARLDAQRFAHMLEHSLGVPDQNIHLLTDNDATRGDVLAKLRWFQEHIPSDGRVYFFFSGHGTPHVQTGDSYLLPYEGRPETLEETGLLMNDVLDSLEQTEARDILAFVDACFSGSGERSSLPEGTRPLVPVQETTTAPRVALFSSSGASEISGNAPDAEEGLFTRHLVDAIAAGRADIDGDGQISLQELKTYVAPRVAREARQLNRQQNPTLIVPDELGDPSNIILVWGLPRD